MKSPGIKAALGIRSVCALTALLPLLGLADEVTYRPEYFSVLPGYIRPSKAYGVTGDGVTISGIYGRQFARNWGVELNAQSSTFETGTHRGTDFYQNGATVDLTYSLFDRREAALFTPFALAGAGAVYDDFYPNDRDGFAFVAEAGLGVVTRPLLPLGIRLRVDARYVHDAKEGGHQEPRFLAGLEIPLGRIEHRVEYLPGKTEVREVIKEVVVVRPWIDSDGDGVDDEHDQCRDTPRGLKVDAVGCVIEAQVVALQGVTFATNTARLTVNATTVLDLMYGAFVGQPSLKVEIAGHTDSVGSVRANQKLSQERADAVRDYLVSKGVSPSRLSAHGYGKSRLLIDPEHGADDRERNRRVELRVVAP
jgi:OOP family OmpA-OmpF porin